MREIEIQGHRGCRGLKPENTVEAFKEAIRLGVDALEMDVIFTQDREILVSHDPYMRSHTMAKPDGSPISQEEELDLNIFLMNAEERNSYKSALQPHPDFPEQQREALLKPTLLHLVTELKLFCKEENHSFPALNIEIKTREEWDGVFHETVEIYGENFAKELEKVSWPSEITLQSFDTRMIGQMRQHAPQYKMYYLADEQAPSVEECFEQLGFRCAGFSPYFKEVTPEMVAACRALNVRLVTWTVNDLEDAKRLVELGVDGIITDYPDRINKVVLQPFLKVAEK